MKNSTVIVGVSTIALLGVGAYLYLKGKKSSTVNIVQDSLGLPTTTTTTTTTNTATATPTDKGNATTTATNDGIKALQDVGIKITPTIPTTTTPYVAPSVPVPTVSLENIQKALLALGIDQTRSITELSSPNYIQAKKLAGDIQYLSSYKFKKTPINWKYDQEYSYSEIQMLSKYYGSTVPSSRYMCAGAKGGGVDDCTYKSGISKEDIIKSMTQKLNALGYKLLPNFDIEKI